MRIPAAQVSPERGTAQVLETDSSYLGGEVQGLEYPQCLEEGAMDAGWALFP